MKVINRAKRSVAFNDDAGKHVLEQYESVEVTGDQHLVHVLSLPGISEVRCGGGQVKPAQPYVAAEGGPEALVPTAADLEPEGVEP